MLTVASYLFINSSKAVRILIKIMSNARSLRPRVHVTSVAQGVIEKANSKIKKPAALLKMPKGPRKAAKTEGVAHLLDNGEEETNGNSDINPSLINAARVVLEKEKSAKRVPKVGDVDVNIKRELIENNEIVDKDISAIPMSRKRKPIKSESKKVPTPKNCEPYIKMECFDNNKAPDETYIVQPSPKKRKPVKSDSKIVKSEQDMTSAFLDTKEVSANAKSECLNSIEANTNTEGRKRKTKNQPATVKSEEAIKTESDPRDIEDVIWRPANWEEVLDNILTMRKLHVAPVDKLGCEECPDKDANPKDFRYQTLISVMLSSQTKDEVTFAATQRLINHGLNVDSVLATSDEKIGELIYPAGFWKTKVKYIKQTTQILKDQYDGDVPRTLKELIKLPGVGPKMANIVMSVAWNETVGIAVDTHVHRICNRLGWLPETTKDPEKTRKALEKWLPKEHWDHINVTLVGFGQTICRPVGPSCDKCLNSTLCPFGKTTLEAKAFKKKSPKKEKQTN